MQRIMRFAGPRDSVAAWWQFRDLEIDQATLDRWLLDEFLQRMHRGTYHVGAGEPSFRGRLRGATLRAGRHARVGGLGALHLASVIDREPARIDLVTTGSGRSFDGVRVARTTSLPDVDRTDYAGIPAVSAARAIVDAAPRHPPLRVVRWLRNGEYHGTVELQDVIAADIRLANRGRCDVVRQAIREIEIGNGGTDSALEDLLESMMAGAGFPTHQVGALMPGILRPNERVDFYFREYGLVIEADGPHHREPVQRSIDRRRDRALRAAGLRVIRFWWFEIENEPAKVLDAIRAALAGS